MLSNEIGLLRSELLRAQCPIGTHDLVGK